MFSHRTESLVTCLSRVKLAMRAGDQGVAKCKDKQAQGSGRSISSLAGVCAPACANASPEGPSHFRAANAGCQVRVLRNLPPALQPRPSCRQGPPASARAPGSASLPALPARGCLRNSSRGVLRRRQIPALGSHSSSKESGSPSVLAKDCKLTELPVPSAELSFNQQSGFLCGQWVA